MSAGGEGEGKGYHVADEQEVAQADGLWAEDDDGGEGQGQHQVPRRDRVGHHEEPATCVLRRQLKSIDMHWNGRAGGRATPTGAPGSRRSGRGTGRTG